MTFAYPLLQETIRFEENKVNVLVIENKVELRKLLSGIREQLEGFDGELILAEKGQIIEFSKALYLITDPFSLDFDSKKLLAKVAQEACLAGEEYTGEIQRLMSEINSLAFRICSRLDFDAAFSELEAFEDIVKLMGFRVDAEEMSFPEKLLEFIKLQRRFFNKKLFVFYNLRACLSNEELLMFYRCAMYEKQHLLLIEDIARSGAEEYEKTVIIDKDLCIF